MMRRASLAVAGRACRSDVGGCPRQCPDRRYHRRRTGGEDPAGCRYRSRPMEILDKQKKAIFKGNVKAKRGNVDAQLRQLTSTYTETVRMPTATKKTEVTFLDADGNVVIVNGSQTVTGKTAQMDVKANKVSVKAASRSCRARR